METSCEQVEVAGAYVLGGLSERQRERFERHVQHCDLCAEELDLLTRAVAAPAVMGTPAKAPVLERGATATLPPRATAPPSAPEQPSATAASRSTALSPRTPSDSPRKRGRRRLVRPIPKPAMVGLGCLLLIAIVTVAMSQMAAPPRFVHGQTAWPNHAGIALKIDGGKSAELLTVQLPKAPSGEHYEVWALPNGAHGDGLTQMATNLALNSGGEAGLSLPGDIRKVAFVGIYAEPDTRSAAARTVTIRDHPVAIVYPDAKR